VDVAVMLPMYVWWGQDSNDSIVFFYLGMLIFCSFAVLGIDKFHHPMACGHCFAMK
jgi:hypothetical protein